MAVGALGLSMGLVMLIVSIVVGAFFLWLSAKLFKLRDKSFVTPLTIVAIVQVVSFVIGLIPVVNVIGWLVAIVLEVWLIMSKYSLGLGKSILVWLVAFVLTLVVMGVIALLFLGSMMAGFGMMGMTG